MINGEERQKIAMMASCNDEFTVTLSQHGFSFLEGAAGGQLREGLGGRHNVKGSFLWSKENPQECLMKASKNQVDYPGSPLMCSAVLRNEIRGDWESKVFVYVGTADLPGLDKIVHFFLLLELVRK